MSHHMIFGDKPKQQDNKYGNQATFIETAKARSVVAPKIDGNGNTNGKCHVSRIQNVIEQTEMIGF